MKSYILKQAERFLREQKNYRRWLAVFLCLAVMVAIGTTAALKYKGIAMTTDNEEVGMHLEDASASDAGTTGHVHTDECYEEREVLVCDAGKAAQGHVHDDSCYNMSGGTEELTCDKEEHTHDDGCYTTETVTETVSHTETDEEGNETTVEETVGHEESKLTCDKEEHTHGSDCYSVSGGEKTLACGLEEGEGAAESDHVHDESCYKTEKALICGEEEKEEEAEEEVLEEVLEEEFTVGTLSVKQDDYEVIVSYSAEARIPKTAELKVEEFEEDSDEYKDYYAQMVEALPADENGGEMEITFARLFDITILDGGKKIEPETEVEVQINYDDVITEDEEQIGYGVHFPDNGEVEIIDADVKDGKEFGFNQSSFSPSGTFFAVARDEDTTVRTVEITLKKDQDLCPAVSIRPGETIRLVFYTEEGGAKKEVENLETISIDMDYVFQINRIGGGKVEVTVQDNSYLIGAEGTITVTVESPVEYRNINYSIPISVRNATNEYKVVYEDLEPAGDGMEIAEYGTGDFINDEVQEGSVSEEITLPYGTKSLEYKLTKDDSGNYRYFIFKGWKTRNEQRMPEGNTITERELSYFTEETDTDGETVKVLRLIPDWEEAAQGGHKLPEVKFYISLNSIVHETESAATTPDSKDFTFSVFETTTTGKYEYIYWGVDQGNKYSPVIYKDNNEQARRVIVADDNKATADIDEKIRKLAEGVEVTGTGGTYIYKLAEFPSDEAVLKAIRDGNQNITVDGAIVEKKDITTDNFTVRWCVFKHNITDQWHIDGMLVRKQGKLAVTKTFYGDQDAINAVKDNFKITVTEEGNTAPVYTLGLHEKTDNDANNNFGYSEKIENGSETTYVWELDIKAGKTFTVKEKNYRYAGKEDIATLSEYRISNTEINNGGSQVTEDPWKDYTDAGVEVKTESYASDLTYKSFRTANLRNSYLPKNSITVWKYDETSNLGLTGVTFNLKKDRNIQTVYKKGSDYYLYSETGAVGTTELMVDRNGYLIIHGVEGARAGSYTLEEVNCPSGYTKRSVSFTITNTGAVTGNGIKPVDESKHAYRLDISNSSTDKIKITAVKDWGQNPEKKPVEVELWRGDTKLENAVKLDEANSWSHTYETEYPVYVNGKKGDYKLVETMIGDTYRDPGADDDGYQFYEVTVDPLVYDETDKTGTITVHNMLNGGKFSFTKTAENGTTPLRGAKFALYADAVCSGNVLAQATSSSDGEVRFTGLTEDSYYMKETEAPDGYELSGQIYKVTFENKVGKIELYPAEAADGETVNESVAIRTITNKIAGQTINILKTDTSGTVLAGAEFSLNAETLTVEGSYTPEENGYTSDVKGVVVNGLELPYGTYKLTETKAPENYNMVTPITLTVNKDGVTANGAEGEVEIQTNEATETEPVSYTITVKDTFGTLNGITLTKIGDQNQDTKLGGAEFILGRDGKNGREYAVISDKVVSEWTEERSATPIGTEEGTGIGDLPALPSGIYYLKEVTPPTDYVLMTKEVKFEVRTGNNELVLAILDGSAQPDEKNDKNIFISNSMGVVLPEAGGPGTAAYTFGGLAVIAVGLMYGLNMRRRREKGGLN